MNSVGKRDGIDRSKRVAPGCKISESNIIDAPRRRKEVNYKNPDETPERKRKSKNVLEVRNKENMKKLDKSIKSLDLNKEEKVKKSKEKTVKETKKVEKKVEEKEETVEEKKEETVQQEEKKELFKVEETVKEVEKKEDKMEVDDETEEETVQEKVEEKKEEKVQETKVRNRRSSVDKRKSVELRKSTEKKLKNLSVLTDKNIKLMKEHFQHDVVSKITPRKYWNCAYDIPHSMLQFLEYKTEDKVFDNESLELTGINFCGEFVLSPEEMKEYKFIRENEDAMLIADGDQLLVAKQLENKQDLSDFNVYVIYDDDKDSFTGPYKLSEVLGNLEEVDLVEENDE